MPYYAYTGDIVIENTYGSEIHGYEFKNKKIEHKKYVKLCECGYVLVGSYCYIIDSLKEAGLLSEDYKPYCCRCKYREEQNVRTK